VGFVRALSFWPPIIGVDFTHFPSLEHTIRVVSGRRKLEMQKTYCKFYNRISILFSKGLVVFVNKFLPSGF